MATSPPTGPLTGGRAGRSRTGAASPPTVGCRPYLVCPHVSEDPGGCRRARRGADLTGSDFTNAHIGDATFTGSTALPRLITRPADSAQGALVVFPAAAVTGLTLSVCFDGAGEQWGSDYAYPVGRTELTCSLANDNGTGYASLTVEVTPFAGVAPPLASPTPTASATSTATPRPTSTPSAVAVAPVDDDLDATSDGAPLGIAVGVVALVLVVGGAIAFPIVRRRRRRTAGVAAEV